MRPLRKDRGRVPVPLALVNKHHRRSPTDGYFYTPGKLHTLEEAAERLGIERERLVRRAWKRAAECRGSGDIPVAYLEDGVVALFFFEGWKFRFPVNHGARAPEGA